MKRYLLPALVLLASFQLAVSQDTLKIPKKKIVFGDGIYLRDSIWKIGGFAGVTVSQVAFYQWGPGGTNSFAFLINGNAYANYKSGKALWDNNLDVKWGMLANGMIRKAALAKRNFQKNIDILSFKSSVGYELKKSLYLSAKFGFESQFSPSYDYSQTDTTNSRFRKYTVSKFAAPAIITIGPGLTWKPKDYFTLFFSPVEGKLTFVTKDHDGRDTTTAPDGTFLSTYYSDVDETRFGLKRGRGFMGELGVELDLLFQKDVIKNVNWKSHLNVFSSYMNANYNTLLPAYSSAFDSMTVVNVSNMTRFIPVVKWDNDIVLKINKFLSATLSARFVYQYNAIVPVDTRNNSTLEKGADGITDKDKNSNAITAYSKLQIFEQFGVALSYKF